MNTPNLAGLIAAIVTPMSDDFSVDEASLRRYTRWLVDEGVLGLAVNVDTGEGPHLFPDERLRVLEIVREEVAGRALLVAGLAASFTEQARRLARDTAAAGAEALLVFPIPAYQGEPLDPEVPAAYHAAVAEASELPLIAFQLQPALGGVNFSEEAITRVMSVDGVVAIKEASFDAKRFVETARHVKSLPSSPTVLNGNDNFLLEAYLLGAEGALLGFGTLAAREQVEMHEAARAGDLERASKLRDMLQPLCDAIFSAAGPQLPRAREARARSPGGDRRVPRPPAAPAARRRGAGPRRPRAEGGGPPLMATPTTGPRIGVFLPTFVGSDGRSGEQIAAFARRAEELGFDSLWATDHLLHGNRFYDVPWLDPIVALTYAASATSRIRLGTSILVMPTRHPVVLAKELATLQALSGERFILGAGTGWDEREFEAVGQRKAERGARTDESLEIVRRLARRGIGELRGPLLPARGRGGRSGDAREARGLGCRGPAAPSRGVSGAADPRGPRPSPHRRRRRMDREADEPPFPDLGGP